MRLDDSFDGVKGFAKLAEVAFPFYFGPHLPEAHFPIPFVRTYLTYAESDPVDINSGRIFFLARFDRGADICMYQTIYSPYEIEFMNWSASESIYADAGSVILPPGYYIFAVAQGNGGEVRVLVCLDQASPQYGKIFAWYMAWDSLGTGDNTRGLAFLANSLEEFFAGMQLEDAL